MLVFGGVYWFLGIQNLPEVGGFLEVSKQKPLKKESTGRSEGYSYRIVDVKGHLDGQI